MPVRQRTDAQAQAAVASFREHYRTAPLGRWRSHLVHDKGLGFDGTGLFGSAIEFRPDGTGCYESWGMFSGEPKTEFCWSNVGPSRVALIVAGEDDEVPEEVAYDFYVPEKCDDVLMFERIDGMDTRSMFWRVTGPLVRTDESS